MSRRISKRNSLKFNESKSHTSRRNSKSSANKSSWLDSGSDISDRSKDNPLWWKDLPDNPGRRSVFVRESCASRNLNSDSNASTLEVTDEWWKRVDSTHENSLQHRSKSAKKNTGITDEMESSASDSENDRMKKKKKFVLGRRKNRSHDTNPFNNALTDNQVEKSSHSKRTTVGKLNFTDSSESIVSNTVQRQSNETSGNKQLRPGKVFTMKSKFLQRHNASGNPFDNILQDTISTDASPKNIAHCGSTKNIMDKLPEESDSDESFALQKRRNNKFARRRLLRSSNKTENMKEKESESNRSMNSPNSIVFRTNHNPRSPKSLDTILIRKSLSKSINRSASESYSIPQKVDSHSKDIESNSDENSDEILPPNHPLVSDIATSSQISGQESFFNNKKQVLSNKSTKINTTHNSLREEHQGNMVLADQVPARKKLNNTPIGNLKHRTSTQSRSNQNTTDQIDEDLGESESIARTQLQRSSKYSSNKNTSDKNLKDITSTNSEIDQNTTDQINENLEESGPIVRTQLQRSSKNFSNQNNNPNSTSIQSEINQIDEDLEESTPIALTQLQMSSKNSSNKNNTPDNNLKHRTSTQSRINPNTTDRIDEDMEESTPIARTQLQRSSKNSSNKNNTSNSTSTQSKINQNTTDYINEDLEESESIPRTQLQRLSKYSSNKNNTPDKSLKHKTSTNSEINQNTTDQIDENLEESTPIARTQLQRSSKNFSNKNNTPNSTSTQSKINQNTTDYINEDLEESESIARTQLQRLSKYSSNKNNTPDKSLKHKSSTNNEINQNTSDQIDEDMEESTPIARTQLQSSSKNSLNKNRKSNIVKPRMLKGQTEIVHFFKPHGSTHLSETRQKEIEEKLKQIGQTVMKSSTSIEIPSWSPTMDQRLNKFKKFLSEDAPPKNPKRRATQPILINGKVYKKPRLARPKEWVTDRLYRRIQRCMEPRYKEQTKVQSERFVKKLAKVVDFIIKQKRYDDYVELLESLMKEMARLKILTNRYEFYTFCYEFLHYDFRIKVIPMLLPGNVYNIPYDESKLYTPLLDSP